METAKKNGVTKDFYPKQLEELKINDEDQLQ